MDDDIEENNLTEVARWVPRVVVVGALAGFIALAWYAYRTGTQSIRDEDLLVVEADKTPMKEKPADPGGMKFPNQDKTIFETFAGNPQPPKVERLMPTPEEPKLRQLDTSETKTWINDKLYQKEETVVAEEKPEQVIAPPPAAAPVKEIPKPSPIEAKRNASPNNVVSYTMDNTLALRAPTPAPPPIESKPEPKEAALPAKVEMKPEPKPEPKPAPKAEPKPAGKFKIQLGAYGAEKEAAAAFSKLQKKFPALADKDPIIVRADLGSKGIFYRLRVGGFADAAEAKSFCGRLKGQACIPAH